MPKSSSLILVCCICVSLSSLLAPAEGAQCTVHPDHKCQATCNGTTFDISKIFGYPMNVIGKYYSYLLDPCNGVVCPDAFNTTGVAFCQKADQYYNCGLIKEPIWLFNYNFQDIQFTVQYPWGTDWRITEITFIEDKSVEKTTIEFVNEKPNLQYNFLVRGKCIGQPYDDCK
ncbi:uncharacterized protein LOC135346725 [Halichondria panicea]|uniref:uncharacterized protein LOC135346725 n=1 Tax=Halichondria panicea TaxID=6063 RepID=UPI00312B70FA